MWAIQGQPIGQIWPGNPVCKPLTYVYFETSGFYPGQNAPYFPPKAVPPNNPNWYTFQVAIQPKKPRIQTSLWLSHLDSLIGLIQSWVRQNWYEKDQIVFLVFVSHRISTASIQIQHCSTKAAIDDKWTKGYNQIWPKPNLAASKTRFIFLLFGFGVFWWAGGGGGGKGLRKVTALFLSWKEWLGRIFQKAASGVRAWFKLSDKPSESAALVITTCLGRLFWFHCLND